MRFKESEVIIFQFKKIFKLGLGLMLLDRIEKCSATINLKTITVYGHFKTQQQNINGNTKI